MLVGSLDGKDPLGKTMATHSSIFAWRIPWTEEPSRLQSIGSQRVGTRLKRLSPHARAWVYIFEKMYSIFISACF